MQNYGNRLAKLEAKLNINVAPKGIVVLISQMSTNIFILIEDHKFEVPKGEDPVKYLKTVVYKKLKLNPYKTEPIIITLSLCLPISESEHEKKIKLYQDFFCERYKIKDNN